MSRLTSVQHADAVHGQRKPIILLVEDDRDIAVLIRFRLEREGFELRHAADGEQALQEFDRPQLPDLVVLDVLLPYHNGFELLANLRQRPSWANVPVIMLTARDSEEDMIHGLAAGANDYLIKPFRPGELVMRMNKLLGLIPEANS